MLTPVTAAQCCTPTWNRKKQMANRTYANGARENAYNRLEPKWLTEFYDETENKANTEPHAAPEGLDAFIR